MLVVPVPKGTSPSHCLTGSGAYFGSLRDDLIMCSALGVDAGPSTCFESQESASIVESNADRVDTGSGTYFGSLRDDPIN